MNNGLSLKVFAYLLKMAQFCDIKNKDGQNLLVKKLEKSRFVNEKSVLARYLNPTNNSQKKTKVDSLIFPFGCNSSQLKAVRSALENQVSIIQGPPGTGKTQTILNIIANLLMNEKNVLVVSNNNDATSNVYEKLASKKYGLDFICATMGNFSNVENFLHNQKQSYPDYLEIWKKQIPMFNVLLDEKLKKLEKFFETNEKIASIKNELSSLEIESKYFHNGVDFVYSSKKMLRKNSSKIMTLLQKIQFEYSEKEKLGIIENLKLRIIYGLGEKLFWKSDVEKIILTIKSVYYSIKKDELKSELFECEQFVKTFNPSEVYENSLLALKIKIAKKYSKSLKRVQFKDGKEIFHHPELFTKEYPVILSTTFSSRETIGCGRKFLFDYVIMDEASQVDVVTGALALSCAQNAVIVGDKMQLPNVIEESKRQNVKKIFAESMIPAGYNFENSFLSSLEIVLPETPQTLLREHYRCHPKIINFCNQQFYGGKLLIMTDDNGERDVLKIVKTVSGNFCSNHYNQRQIDVIKKELLPLYSENEKSNLGIIAPYNNQVNKIKTQIQGVDVATVHKYQGREKDVIIISTVDNVITDFADDSNMLNVAISRAKKKIVIVTSGNEQPKKSNLAALIKYIQFNNGEILQSKVCSIFDFFYSKENSAKFEFLKSTNKLSKFDSENAMNELLTKIFSEPEFYRFGFVFELPLKNIVNKKILNQLPLELSEFVNKSWTHVDFTIFNRVTKEILFGIEVDGYKYHKNGTKQAERDKKKNQIFDLIGLPLLRFSTKGSDEEEKIREVLIKMINSSAQIN